MPRHLITLLFLLVSNVAFAKPDEAAMQKEFYSKNPRYISFIEDSITMDDPIWHIAVALIPRLLSDNQGNPARDVKLDLQADALIARLMRHMSEDDFREKNSTWRVIVVMHLKYEKALLAFLEPLFSYISLLNDYRDALSKALPPGEYPEQKEYEGVLSFAEDDEAIKFLKARLWSMSKTMELDRAVEKLIWKQELPAVFLKARERYLEALLDYRDAMKYFLVQSELLIKETDMRTYLLNTGIIPSNVRLAACRGSFSISTSPYEFALWRTRAPAKQLKK